MRASLETLAKYYGNPYRHYRPDAWKDAQTRGDIREAIAAVEKTKRFSGYRGPVNDAMELQTKEIVDVYERMLRDHGGILKSMKLPTNRGAVHRRGELRDTVTRLDCFIELIEDQNSLTAAPHRAKNLLASLSRARKHYETNGEVRGQIDQVMNDIKKGRLYEAIRGPEADETEKRTRKLVSLYASLRADLESNKDEASFAKNRGKANKSLDIKRAVVCLDTFITKVKAFDNTPRDPDHESYVPKQSEVKELNEALTTLRRYYDGHLTAHEPGGLIPAFTGRDHKIYDAEHRRAIDPVLDALQGDDGFRIARGPQKTQSEDNMLAMGSLYDSLSRYVEKPKSRTLEYPAKFEAFYSGYLRVVEGGRMTAADARHDGSGRTEQGVTQATYESYHRAYKCCAACKSSNKKSHHSVFSITADEHKEIFYRMYWVKHGFQKMPERAAWVLMDFAVNGGKPDSWKFEAAKKIELKYSNEKDFYEKVNKLSEDQENLYLVKLIGLKADFYRRITARSFTNRRDELVSRGVRRDTAIVQAASESLMRYHDGWQNRLIELACRVDLEPQEDFFNAGYLVPRELKDDLRRATGVDFGMLKGREQQIEARAESTPSIDARYDKLTAPVGGVRLRNASLDVYGEETTEMARAVHSLSSVTKTLAESKTGYISHRQARALEVQLGKVREYFEVGFWANAGSGFDYGKMCSSMDNVLEVLRRDSPKKGLRLTPKDAEHFKDLLVKLRGDGRELMASAER